MLSIVADDKIPFLKGALENHALVEYYPGASISADHLRDADVVITRTRTKCNERLLEDSRVSFIASATIGYDHIDAAYCAEKGIQWTNAPGCNSSSVEQYIVSTLLYLADKKGLKLNELTLGVVGVGNVGSKVARMGRALGMEVMLNDPPRQRAEKRADFVELNQLLEKADIITLHVPLIKEGRDKTYHMVNTEFHSRVKKGAVLINTSRGPVVDESALIKGMEAGTWSDVVLDVFENEPNINPALLNLITLATPHIAGYSLDGKANGTTMSVRAISRFFGLGLENWTPSHVPPPEVSVIQGDASDSNLQELLWQIYSQCYDVSGDDRRLRNAPHAFENLRGDYPPRREAGAYSVRLFQGYPEIIEVLEAMGFSVLGDYCA